MGKWHSPSHLLKLFRSAEKNSRFTGPERKPEWFSKSSHLQGRRLGAQTSFQGPFIHLIPLLVHVKCTNSLRNKGQNPGFLLSQLRALLTRCYVPIRSLLLPSCKVAGLPWRSTSSTITDVVEESHLGM